MRRQDFTEEQIKWMIDNCNMNRRIMAEQFNELFGRKVHQNVISRKLSRLGLTKIQKHKSPKSVVMPELTEKLHGNGHLLIKFKGRWINKSRYTYEQHHGIKLTNNDVIIHLDGDKTNDHIDNLKLSNRRVVAKLLKMGFSDNVKRTAVAIAELELKIKDIENDN